MGGQTSSKPASVDLLPPRFDRAQPALDRVPMSPLEYMFGASARDKVINDHLPEPATASLRARLTPGLDEDTSVTLDVGGGGGAAGDIGASLDFRHSGSSDALASSLRSPLLVYDTRSFLSLDGFSVLASAVEPQRGLGAYVALPIDFFVSQAARAAASAAAAAGSAAPRSAPLPPMSPREALARQQWQVGRGVGGNGTSSPPKVENGGAAKPPAVQSTARLGGPHPAAARLAFPEVGVRFAPSEALAMGVHAGAVAPYPLRAWTVLVSPPLAPSPPASEEHPGDGGGGAAGNTVDGPTFSFGAEILTTLQRSLAARAAQPSIGSAREAAAAISAAADFNIAASIKQPQLYELSLAWDGTRRDIVAGFIQTLTLRRSVMNIFEERRVKGIYNYVDLAFELRRRIGGEAGKGGLEEAADVDDARALSTVAAGVSWQANRNLMLKARLGSRGAAASMSYKTSGDPCVTLSLSAGSAWENPSKRALFGVALAVERGGGSLEYSKPILSLQTATPNRQLAASPELNARLAEGIDNDAFLRPSAQQQGRRTRIDPSAGRGFL